MGYDLDPVGNRLSDTSSLTGVPSGSWGYNADDELSSETYDQDGNVTAADGKSFTYDSQNELVSMNGGAVQIMYDGDGNRVAKSVNGVVTRTYTYGLQRISEDQVINSAWTPSFYSYDGMGSVRQLTNASGAVTDTYEYDAFGNQISHTGTTPNNYLYRGEQWDPDLGMYYLRARYYNPLSGRFMSRDPWSGDQFDPKTLHKYLYVGSDPANYTDPRGRADLFEYAIRTSAAIPEANLIDIYGCVADASLTAVSLIINPTISASTALGGGAALIGCVALTPGLNELAETGSKITKRAIGFIKLVGVSADWGSCATDIEEFVNGLNDELSGTANGVQITNSITALTGCVGNALGEMITHPGATLQGLEAVS